MTLVVVDVSGEHNDAKAGLSLPGFEKFGQFSFRGPRRMAAAKQLRVRETRVGRMMVHHENEIYIRENAIEFRGQPRSLRPVRFRE